MRVSFLSLVFIQEAARRREVELRRQQEAAIARVRAEAEAKARLEARERSRQADEQRMREEHEARLKAQVSCLTRSTVEVCMCSARCASILCSNISSELELELDLSSAWSLQQNACATHGSSSQFMKFERLWETSREVRHVSRQWARG